MGNNAKQMLKKRLRAQSKMMRSNLRDIGRLKIYYPARPDGTPFMGPMNADGQMVQVTWAYPTPEQAEAQILILEDEFKAEGIGGENSEMTMGTMQAVQLLHGLMMHLSQADMDLLLTGTTKYPMTTMGVKVLDDEDWTKCLKDARANTSVLVKDTMTQTNPLLVEVIRRFLIEVSPEDKVFLEQTDAGDLQTLVVGKMPMPMVDMGIVWMMAAKNDEGEVEPLFLKLNGDFPDNPVMEDLALGPFFFSSRQAALDWAQVLPPNIARHFEKVDVILDAYRGLGMLEEIHENFPTANMDVDEDNPKRPDVVLLDGGCLPMTIKGGKYADYIAYGDDKPERGFQDIAEDGLNELRQTVVYLAAKALGIKIQFLEPGQEG